MTAAAVLAGWRWELSRSPLIVLGTFVLLFVGIAAAVRGSRVAAVGLVPLAALWVISNGLVEGPTLLTLSDRHGITTADILSAVALGVAAWRLLAEPARRWIDGS